MPGRRQMWHDQGAALAASDFALSAGWGSTAALTLGAGSRETGGQIVVAAAGASQGANPTITLTFKSAFAQEFQPFAVACRGDAADAQGTLPVMCKFGAGNATLVITLIGTPSGSQTFTINYLVQG